MPIYEYECLECKKIFEKLESMYKEDRNCPGCPECGKGSRRIFSPPALIRVEGGTLTKAREETKEPKDDFKYANLNTERKTGEVGNDRK